MTGINKRMLLFWFVALGMYGSVLWWCFASGASTTVRADHWRYLHIVSDYYQSGLTTADLLYKHGEHLQILYNIWFLMNSLWFGLNTRLELFIGLLFLGVSSILLYKLFNNSIFIQGDCYLKRLMFLPIASVIFSFHQIQSFAYSLLAFVGFLELLLLFSYLYFLDMLMRHGRLGRWQWLAMGGAFFLLSVGVAGGGWVCYWCASIVTLIFWTSVNKNKHTVNYLSIIYIILLAVPIVSLNIMGSVNHGHHSSIGGFEYIFTHAGETAHYLVVLFANTVIDFNVLERKGYVSVAYIFGFVFFISYLCAYCLYIRLRLWEKSYVPLFLMLTYLFIVAALVLYRFPIFGLNNAASPRYATSLQIGFIGVLWTFIISAWEIRRPISSYMKGIVVFFVSSLYIFQFGVAFRAEPAYRKFEVNAINTLVSEDFSKRSVVCPHESLCREGMPVLRSHSLNVFSNKRAKDKQMRD